MKSLLSMLFFALLLGACRDFTIDETCPGWEDGFVLDVHSDVFVSPASHWNAWGSVYNPEGVELTTRRLIPSQTAHFDLPNYCPDLLDYTTAIVSRRPSGSYDVELKTIASIGNQHQHLLFEKIVGYTPNANTIRILNLPDDVEQIDVPTAYGFYTHTISPDGQVATVRPRNTGSLFTASGHTVLVRTKRASESFYRGHYSWEYGLDRDLDYADFEALNEHIIALPDGSGWKGLLMGILDDDPSNPVVLARITASSGRPTVAVNVPDEADFTGYRVVLENNFFGTGVVEYRKDFASLPDSLPYTRRGGTIECQSPLCSVGETGGFSVAKISWMGSFVNPDGDTVNLEWEVYLPGGTPQVQVLPALPFRLVEQYPFLENMKSHLTNYSLFGYQFDGNPGYQTALRHLFQNDGNYYSIESAGMVKEWVR